MVTSNAPTVDAYLQELAPERREDLETIRAMIKEAAPDAEEAMQYGLPGYTLDGPLFAFAAQNRYLAPYVSEPDLLEAHLPRLGKVNTGKNCIRFTKLSNLALDGVGALLKAAARRRGLAP